MKHKKLAVWLLVFTLLLTSLAGCGISKDSDGDGALIPNPIAPNAVTLNPYMANSDNSVHNDTYSSDVTNAVLPLGIGSSLRAALETKNPQAPSAAFYDEKGNAITPFNGGIAIADMSGDTITRQGVFVPAVHDSEQYRVQISYSFVDCDNNVVLPTTHGHVIVLRTYDETGAVLPVFEKILDVDVAKAAQAALGNDIDTRLLSIVYDYNGNLWFVTGGFQIHPNRDPAGFLGYLSREYIDKAQAGESIAAEKYLHFYRLADGEGAENGISASEHGAVILTNMACYMLNANDGVEVVWRTEYESNGVNTASKDSEYTGIGLAYGSGTTPTLTKNLVLFTDNADPINLLALSSETGEVVSSVPVLDQLGDDIPVAVENSILVYSGNDERTSVVVCNWFGAGNAGLSEPDADTSVQSYANLYDANWMAKGNKYIAPGVERVDVVKTDTGYKAEKVWLRKDIRDTSMIKLSTATGYLYGYWQDIDTGMWKYEVLNFENGDTVYTVPVSDLAGYNNLAVGMIADVKGNALYCPTGNMEMVCWQDDFVYLPYSPVKTVELSDMERYRLTDKEFQELSNTTLSPASYLMKATVKNVGQETELAFKLNGLDGNASDYTLYVESKDGALKEYNGKWSLCTATGEAVQKLNAGDVVEIRMSFRDGDESDLNEAEKTTKLSVILVKK